MATHSSRRSAFSRSTLRRGAGPSATGSCCRCRQNTALFSLLGTTYGGNGKSNFALPDLQGSAPMHPGQGPGLSLHDLGETGGSETVTLLQSEIPAARPRVRAAADPASSTRPRRAKRWRSASAGSPINHGRRIWSQWRRKRSPPPAAISRTTT